MSVFSVSYFENEIQVNILIHKNAEQAYLSIPSCIFTDVLWNTYGKQEIFNHMKRLLVGESFRIAWNDVNHKYILITKTAISSDKLIEQPVDETNDDIIVTVHNVSSDHFIDDVVNNPSIVNRNLKIKLPPSPDLDDKDKDTINYTIFCTRYIVNLTKWAKDFLVSTFETYIFSTKVS